MIKLYIQEDDGTYLQKEEEEVHYCFKAINGRLYIKYFASNDSRLRSEYQNANYSDASELYVDKEHFVHRINGPAVIFRKITYGLNSLYGLNGMIFRKKEEWFSALTTEQKKIAAFNLDQI